VPDVDSLKKHMRFCYENQEEVKTKGKKASLDAMNWTWHISAKKALSFLNELL